MTAPQDTSLDAALETIGYHVAWLRWQLSEAREALIDVRADWDGMPPDLGRKVDAVLTVTASEGDAEDREVFDRAEQVALSLDSEVTP